MYELSLVLGVMVEASEPDDQDDEPDDHEDELSQDVAGPVHVEVEVVFV